MVACLKIRIIAIAVLNQRGGTCVRMPILLLSGKRAVEKLGVRFGTQYRCSDQRDWTLPALLLILSSEL